MSSVAFVPRAARKADSLVPGSRALAASGTLATTRQWPVISSARHSGEPTNIGNAVPLNRIATTRFTRKQSTYQDHFGCGQSSFRGSRICFFGPQPFKSICLQSQRRQPPPIPNRFRIPMTWRRRSGLISWPHFAHICDKQMSGVTCDSWPRSNFFMLVPSSLRELNITYSDTDCNRWSSRSDPVADRCELTYAYLGHPDPWKGLGGSNDCLPATQSAISAFSAGSSKMLRMLARFLRPEGTGEAWVLPSAAHLCSILSVENRAGALPSVVAIRSGEAASKQQRETQHTRGTALGSGRFWIRFYKPVRATCCRAPWCWSWETRHCARCRTIPSHLGASGLSARNQCSDAAPVVHLFWNLLRNDDP